MSRNRRLWTATVFATMAVTGMAMMARGPVIPHLRDTYLAPEWQLGLIAPAGMVGYLLVVALVGFGAGHLEPRRFVALGLAGSGVSLLAMGAAPLLGVFLLAIVVRGTMNGVVRGLNRPIVSHFYPENRGRMYSYYDMIWALGAMGGPVLVVAAVAVGSWRLAYYALAGVMFLLAAIVWLLDAPAVETDEEPIDRAELRELFARPEVLAMLVAMFFGTGVEGGLFTWLPTYADGELPATLAGVTLSVMVAGYVPGRFLYGRLAERVGYVRLLVVVLALLVPAFAGTFLLADGLWLLAGVAVIGALISGVYPLLISYATDAAPQHSGPVTAIAAVSSSLGVGIVPALMGGVISGADAGLAMQLLLVPIGISLVVLVVARVGERRRDREGTPT
ncbi:MAG: sugar MFS transporter [Haloarculaceae archaeon]